MELDIEIKREIISLVTQGKRNRNSILLEVVKDYKVLTVLELYQQRKNDYQISSETRIAYDKVVEIMNYIDEISRFIDARILRMTQENYRNKNKNVQEQSAYLRRMSKKDVLERKLNYCKKKFYDKKVSEEALRKNIDKLIEMVDLLDRKPQDLNFIVQVLLELEMVEKAEKMLYETTYTKNLTKYEETILNMRRNDIIKAKITKKIKKMFSDGLSEGKIIENLELSLTGEERRCIDRRFLKSAISELKNEGQDKIMTVDSSKSKDDKIKDEDEEER